MTQKLEFTADVLRRHLAAAGDLEHADQLRSEILQQVGGREREAQELVAEAAQARLVAEEQRDQAQEEADQAAASTSSPSIPPIPRQVASGGPALWIITGVTPRHP